MVLTLDNIGTTVESWFCARLCEYAPDAGRQLLDSDQRERLGQRDHTVRRLIIHSCIERPPGLSHEPHEREVQPYRTSQGTWHWLVAAASSGLT